MTQEEFRQLLQTVADGWNAGDAHLAADCFTEDVVYVEPPDRQRYVGRRQLVEFFGRGVEFSMTWHRIAFDEDEQAGFGEYTFSVVGEFTLHGITAIEIEDGLIGGWREYQYRSELPFEEFAAGSLRR
jgi:uncharacterized protein (TIGR02246 family)